MQFSPLIIALVALARWLTSAEHPMGEAEAKAAELAKMKAAEAKKPLSKEELAKVIETAIRKVANKPTGELTKADLEKVTWLNFNFNQLTEVKGLEKLTQLEFLNLAYNQLTDVKGLENFTQLKGLNLAYNKLTDVKGLEKLTKLQWLRLQDNPALTKAQIAELQKALPKCDIYSNAKK